ncbi:MAG: DASS family sodium-coupled anion symporter [Ignavibacteriaceae bacterium]|nr:DASS family sodium-coupled anion symporter [Ignavibacteriaceae bacterium]
MPPVKKIGLLGGLVTFIVIILFIDLDPLNPDVTKMAAVATLMAIWWMTEAVPLAATSLLPIILFPILGILDGEKTSSSYINSVVFLFIGGFLLALAMEKWNLHKRIALKIITFFGASLNAIVIGFMAATAFISMWISNTATAIMMLPIGLAVITKIENEFGKEVTHNFSVTLMLVIAYACSLGGLTTLIGTPTNLVFVRVLKISFPNSPSIGFGNWMLLGIPIAIIMLLFTAFLLTKVFFKYDKSLKIRPDLIEEEYKSLGKIAFEESIVAIVFSLTVLLWIFRTDMNLGFLVIPGWAKLFSFSNYLNDGIVAVAMALLLFIIPASKNADNQRMILDSTIFSKVPWGVILLFGGGFAIAEGFTSTGLSQFIGSKLQGITLFSPIVIVILTAFIITFLSELTSNTATVQMVLPILASVSVAAQINPLLLMITATFAASMGFMLPVATPPNTIAFSSERLKILEMVKAGFWMNIFGVVVISILVYLLGTVLFNLNEFPTWAVTVTK